MLYLNFFLKTSSSLYFFQTCTCFRSWWWNQKTNNQWRHTTTYNVIFCLFWNQFVGMCFILLWLFFDKSIANSIYLKCELRLHITIIFKLQKYWQMQDISWVKECRENWYRDEIRCSSCRKRGKCMTSLRYIYGLDLFTKAIEWSKRLMFHLRIDIVDCKEQIDLCVLMWRQATYRWNHILIFGSSSSWCISINNNNVSQISNVLDIRL